jgi:hypothetical protein
MSTGRTTRADHNLLDRALHTLTARILDDLRRRAMVYILVFLNLS